MTGNVFMAGMICPPPEHPGQAIPEDVRAQGFPSQGSSCIGSAFLDTRNGGNRSTPRPSAENSPGTAAHRLQRAFPGPERLRISKEEKSDEPGTSHSMGSCVVLESSL